MKCPPSKTRPPVTRILSAKLDEAQKKRVAVALEPLPGEAAMRTFEVFNQSRFSRFINSPLGRVFRLVAGTGFLVAGVLYRNHALGLAALAWCSLPLSAGGFDVCYVSAALGGPLAGARIREAQRGALAPGRTS